MSNENMQTIEINGIKMEVDLRYAKRIDTIRVGDKVKLLAKSDYGEPKVVPGVVVGFEPFETLPTIIVTYLEISYSGVELKFAYVNDKSRKNWEIVPSIDDEMPVDKADVLEGFRKERAKLQNSIEELDRKEAYFLRHFQKYFEQQPA